MKKTIILISIITLGMMFAFFDTPSVAAAADLKYTVLYEADEDWCSGLHIIVSGNKISSKDYELIECAESSTVNTWYCNCEQDDDFEVVFVNYKTDPKTYIVDIKSGSNNVRRVIARNKFNGTTTQSVSKPEINTYDTVFLNIDKRIQDNKKRLESLEKAPKSTTQNITNVIEYDATDINIKMVDLENKINILSNRPDRTGFSSFLGWCSFLAMIGIIIFIWRNTEQ